MKTVNAGKYNHRISIFETKVVKDSAGFQSKERVLALKTYASIKTTKGMTLIANGSDFEKAYTNFTIRYPVTKINRDMEVEFGGKIYTIEYINNVDERNVELELQCKEVTH